MTSKSNTAVRTIPFPFFASRIQAESFREDAQETSLETKNKQKKNRLCIHSDTSCTRRIVFHFEFGGVTLRRTRPSAFDLRLHSDWFVHLKHLIAFFSNAFHCASTSEKDFSECSVLFHLHNSFLGHIFSYLSRLFLSVLKKKKKKGSSALFNNVMQ